MSRVRLSVALAVVAALGVAVFALWPSVSRPRIDATVAVREALASDDAGFARALVPRSFSFPADHGPHPDFRTEWWYYTGNLKTAAGRHFGADELGSDLRGDALGEAAEDGRRVISNQWGSIQ